ncbi:unnamed protein product, partial [Didymodactylos carnosus]
MYVRSPLLLNLPV